MKLTLTTLVLCIIAMFGVIMLFKKCDKDSPAASEIRETKDSVNIVLEQERDLYKKKYDSVLIVSTRQEKDIDSIKTVGTKLTKNLEVSKLQVALLVAKHNELKPDTSTAYTRNCDSLSSEAIVLVQKVDYAQKVVGSLQLANESLRATNKYQLGIKDSSYNSLQRAYIAINDKLSESANTVQALTKKAKPKPIGIGLQAGVTLSGGKPFYYGGIGISYNFIRF